VFIRDVLVSSAVWFASDINHHPPSYSTSTAISLPDAQHQRECQPSGSRTRERPPARHTGQRRAAILPEPARISPVSDTQHGSVPSSPSGISHPTSS
jgi:hypothetical protein